MTPLVEIWDFESAPQEWKDLSKHGGDEDYIVVVRDGFDGLPLEEERSDFLNRYFWEKHEYNGLEIWIGAHS